MKNKILVANWKMNLSPDEEISLLKEVANLFKNNKKNIPDLEIIICPSFLALKQAKEVIKELPNFHLGAQNCFWEDKGAYTGEISPLYLKQIGIEFIILGHSERRTYLGEANEMINKKVRACLKNDLCPIICVGETFEEQQEGKRDYTIMHQTSTALEGLQVNENKRILIAYEPVWVIGRGKAVEPEQAEYANRVIQQTAIDCLPLDFVKQKMSFLYGGSIDEENVVSFKEQKTIDGFLVGGASLNPKEFFGIALKM